MPRETPAITVLRRGAPGLKAETLCTALRDRLPHHDVALAATPKEERALIAERPVVVGNGITEDRIDSAGHLRLYVHTSSGVEDLPMAALAAADVAVTNTSGLTPYAAEQVIGYLLVFARDLHKGMRRQRRREPRHYQPRSLSGSRVTIVGLGAIGQEIATCLNGFDIDTVGVRYTPSKGGPTDTVIGYGETSLHEALSGTDYLVLSCPLTDTTRGLIGAAKLATLPTDAVVANIARGAVLDTEALTVAIERNTLRGAALDVTEPEPLPPDHPLWRFENVLLTPHNAGNAPDHWERVAGLVARNLDRIEEGGGYDDLENLVLTPGESY